MSYIRCKLRDVTSCLMNTEISHAHYVLCSEKEFNSSQSFFLWI